MVSTRRRAGSALSAAAAVVPLAVAVILLWPSPVDRPLYGTLLRGLRWLHARGLPDWVDYAAVEAGANVLLFVPLGIFAAAVLPPRCWWLALLLCIGFSAGMEACQAVFLPERQGSAQDFLLNGGGALLGVALVEAGRRLRRVPLAA